MLLCVCEGLWSKSQNCYINFYGIFRKPMTTLSIFKILGQFFTACYICLPQTCVFCRECMQASRCCTTHFLCRARACRAWAREKICNRTITCHLSQLHSAQKSSNFSFHNAFWVGPCCLASVDFWIESSLSTKACSKEQGSTNFISTFTSMFDLIP